MPHIQVIKSHQKHIEIVPVERYLRHWRNRYVAFNQQQQVVEIMEHNPVNAQNYRVTFVCDWDYENGIRVYKPFDHQWVEESLAGKYAVERYGIDHVSREIDEHNEKNTQRILKEQQEKITDNFAFLRDFFNKTIKSFNPTDI